jgi:condensin complex subunit 1
LLFAIFEVKGQISEMALCLEDKEPRIADLARLFFHELSCKGNMEKMKWEEKKT